MTVRQSNRKKLFWYVSVSFFCIAVTSMCLTACHLKTTGEESGQADQNDLSLAERDSYEAKITYYQAQLQSLTSQINDMEQQMYLLRENYMGKLESLEQKINEVQQRVPESEKSEDSAASLPEASEEAGSIKTEATTEHITHEYTYRLENGFAVLTSYIGEGTEVVVPAAIDGYVVIGLDDRTFAKTDVERVVVPETVESIGWFAFYECADLREVVLPEKLAMIGYASFDGCPTTLCLQVIKGSYAEKFAISFGLRYKAL